MRYFQLDEAIQELRRRQNEPWIIERLSSVIGRDAWESCPFSSPMGVIGLLPRHIATARLEDIQFFERCREAGLWPVWGDHTNDMWSSENRDKLRLCHIRVNGEVNFSRRIVKNPQRWNRRPIAMVTTDSGEPLVDFHHRLWDAVFGGQGEIVNVSSWFEQLGGRAKHYYFAYLAAMSVKGVLFESFDTDGAPPSFATFVRQVVEPAWQAVVDQVGVEPLIVKHPLADSLEEDQRVRDYYDPRVVPEAKASLPSDSAKRQKDLILSRPLWSGYE